MNYLDTSVLTAYYCREAGSEHIQDMLLGIEERAISPLVKVEFCCAVARKMRSGTLNRETALRIFSEFQVDLAEPRFHVLAIQPTDYELASEWIARLATPLRVLDALHLAVAFSGGLRLITADRELARAAKHFGVQLKLIS